MVKRNKPEKSHENPHLIKALHRAMEHSAVPNDTIFDRMAVLGNVYHVGKRFTITPSQGSAYFYIDNNGVSDPFKLQADAIKVANGDALIYVRDEPTLDESTFSSVEYKNIRSDVTPSPRADAYFGYDSSATVSDKGRIYDEDFIKADAGDPGKSSTGAGENGEVRYIIGDDSSAMLEVENDSSNDIEVSVSAFFHYFPDVPSIIEDPNGEV